MIGKLSRKGGMGSDGLSCNGDNTPLGYLIMKIPSRPCAALALRPLRGWRNRPKSPNVPEYSS